MRVAPLPDAALLRRARRLLAVQAAAGVALVLLLVGATTVAIVVRAQRVAADRVVHDAALHADDVSDPPPGVELVMLVPGRPPQATPGAPQGLAGVLAPAGRYGDVAVGGVPYRTFTARRGTMLVQAALDLRARQTELRRLVTAAAAAGLVGIVAAAAVGSLLARRAIAPLGEALARQGRFVADASHELRTPLTLLHTRAQLLAREAAAAGDPERLRQEAAALVDDSGRLGEVVEDLLLSAELGAGRGAREPVALDALAAEAVDAARAHAAEAGVRLRTDLQPAVVQGVPAALRRVVAALLDNALGHVAADGEVAVRVARDDGHALVEVRDDGPGLAPATAGRLFERFAHGPERGGRRRFGLGLALVDEVVSAHGGRITAASQPGRGARFTVALPLAPPGQQAPGHPGHARQAPGTR